MTPASDDARDDATLMRALQHGEDPALDELMRRWERPLRAFLFRWTQHEADATDLAQETFVRVHRHRARFRAGATFSTWLFQIALNLARDRARHARRHPTAPLDAAPEPAGGPQPDTDALAAERVVAVRAAIAALPADLRTAVLLFEYGGRSHAEIAAVTGATAKAVEGRLHRAREQLRVTLARFLRDRN